MTQRTENLLGVLALLVTDEMNAQPAEAALAGSTARAMLNAIGQYPDSSIEVLREAVDLSHPAAVRAVAGLVEAGLVEKKPGADKRSVALALSASGKREAKRLQAARDQILQRIVGQLDERERGVLESLLIKILWRETRDPAHAMQLCRLCDDGPCLKAGCPVECREQGSADAGAEQPMNAAAPVRWPAIAALTAVSALSQIGQFGIGFMVLPVWLAHQGLDAPRAGLFSASQWTGMLIGLLIAPWLVERIGAKRTVSLGLAATVLAFATMNALWWPLWLVPGLLTGFGIGLRWIANETWLYRLVPAESSGRVVGVHEALIATAGVIGPALAVWCAVDGRIIFAAGAAFTFAAALPLWLTGSDDGHSAAETARTTRNNRVEKHRVEKRAPIGPLVSLGMVVVAAGGIGDGALYGLFPLFADAHGLSVTQTATLLTLFGIGGMALQFPVGWFADRVGLAATVIVCAALSTLAICGFAFAAPASWLADASALLLGGMSSAYITLGMVAAACSDKAALTRNMRLVSLTFTASSIVGPLIAGFAMKARGSDMLMWQLAIMSGALVAYTLGLREGRRQPDRSSSMG